MKHLIPLFLGLAVICFFISGCDSIIDQEPGSDVPLTGVSPSNTLTMEMCKTYPGQKALGYKNLGQCICYVETDEEWTLLTNYLVLTEIIVAILRLRSG